jgi:hypothetical protein
LRECDNAQEQWFARETAQLLTGIGTHSEELGSNDTRGIRHVVLHATEYGLERSRPDMPVFFVGCEVFVAKELRQAG